MKTETVCHWLCQCIWALCGYLSLDHIHMNREQGRLRQSAVGLKWSNARFHRGDIVDPDLSGLRKPDPEWPHPTCLRFNSGKHWQSQWHTFTDHPDIDPTSATPPICPVRRKRRDSEFGFDAMAGVEDLDS